MQNIIDFWNTTLAQAADFFSNILTRIAPWQLLLASGMLLVLVIILIGALSARGRKVDELIEEKEKQAYAALRAEKENRQALSEQEDALLKARRDSEQSFGALREQHAAVVGEKDTAIDSLSVRVDDLTKFQNEYIAIPNARMEAQRIVREAKEHAYVVSNRTEMEYAEIIEHANREADSIRAQAQQRLARSHEALRQALARANEIVEEAHAEATRIARIAYVPGPSLIEAPVPDAAVEPEPQPAPEAAPLDPFIAEAPVADEPDSVDPVIEG